jgi:lactate dehydrogenase-like 2-hydroxyacid dehydrogenase
MPQGYAYAAMVLTAASGADVLSLHLGLGTFNAETGVYANTAIIDDLVFGVMNSGAVVINYDRGELLDTQALERALNSTQVRHAAIDADVFKDPYSGELSGPMTPYLNIYRAHDGKNSGKMSLLPHAAADTDHGSRVAGAKQAVDQVFAAITRGRVVNLKGDLPAGYTDGKAQTAKGIGRVTSQTFDALSDEEV